MNQSIYISIHKPDRKNGKQLWMKDVNHKFFFSNYLLLKFQCEFSQIINFIYLDLVFIICYKPSFKQQGCIVV